ncbi:MAG TPA: hypothetical protein P5026_12500 [Kiritimatiellia bacterium]|nr:hypothetical protein [Kiritimatiellia bacterium]
MKGAEGQAVPVGTAGSGVPTDAQATVGKPGLPPEGTIVGSSSRWTGNGIMAGQAAACSRCHHTYPGKRFVFQR